MSKYFIYRILFFVSIIGITQYVYSTFFFEDDLLKHSDVITLVREVNKDTDILYIGESSNSSAHGDDFDPRKISEFVSDFYPSLIVDDITKPAAHAGNYKVLLKHLPKDNSIQTLIVTLNLRSFGIGWIQSDLETSLNKNMVLLGDEPALYKRFKLAFKGYDNKTKQQRSQIMHSRWKHDEIELPEHFEYNTITKWDGYLFHTGIKDKQGNRNEELTQLACHFVKNYMFNIDTLTNPRIQDFNEIIHLAQENNWNVVFNLLAENTEQGSKLVGKHWTYTINKNRALLVDYFTRKGAIVIDNLDEVPDSLFTDRNWTTEHYHEEGRQTIARNIAKGIQNLHPNDFHAHKYLSPDELIASTNTYAHDMEKNRNWLGENFTSERAKSGNYSCKINQKNLYSVTLEMPYYKLNDAYKHAITYSMNVLASDSNFDASMIIEIQNSKHGNKNLIYPFTPQEVNQTWNSITHRFEIPEIYRDSELIKIFVYNPSSTDVYIDDVSIIFE